MNFCPLDVCPLSFLAMEVVGTILCFCNWFVHLKFVENFIDHLFVDANHKQYKNIF